MTQPQSHLLDLEALLRGAPYAHYAELRAEAPVCRQAHPDGGSYWAVLGHAEALEVLADLETYSPQPAGVLLHDDSADLPTIASVDPARRDSLRARIADALTADVESDLAARMRPVVRRALSRAADRGECELVRDVVAPLPEVVIGDFLGVPEADRERVGGFLEAMVDRSDQGVPHGAARDAAIGLGAYALQLVGERARGRAPAARGLNGAGGGLITGLLDETLAGEPVDLRTFAGLFVRIAALAGEATRALLCGGTRALAERPDDYAALAADPGAIPAAVEEMLRWTTPVHYVRLTAARETALGAQAIDAGDRVAVLYAAANRDPAVFAEPERFDIGRAPNPHLALGAGEHACPGAALARLAARVFFEAFLERFSAVELTAPPERLRSRELHAFARVPVRLTPR